MKTCLDKPRFSGRDFRRKSIVGKGLGAKIVLDLEVEMWIICLSITRFRRSSNEFNPRHGEG